MKALFQEYVNDEQLDQKEDHLHTRQHGSLTLMMKTTMFTMLTSTLMRSTLHIDQSDSTWRASSRDTTKKACNLTRSTIH